MTHFIEDRLSILNKDILNHEIELKEIISKSKLLVIGGAGSIGQSVTKELFKRNPKKLHVVDLSENNLVELVRDLRSSIGYIDGDFQTYAIDIDSIEYDYFIEKDGDYDYVFNLSAIKHVRSEKDPFTLMRMINVNILNTEKTIKQSIQKGVKKYFCVSTDKATNPVNMMGASKRIMEMFLVKYSEQISISTARFANVAFSDGSLLCGFKNRMLKKQPLAAPDDIKRYFITPQEAGELCLLSCLFGEKNDIFFPKIDNENHLFTFSEIAKNFIIKNGYEPFYCDSEEEGRNLTEKLLTEKKWPIFISKSNTSGEKHIEEFYTSHDNVDYNKYANVGILKNIFSDADKKTKLFKDEVLRLKQNKNWTKEQIIILFTKILPEFKHTETGKYLDAKM